MRLSGSNQTSKLKTSKRKTSKPKPKSIRLTFFLWQILGPNQILKLKLKSVQSATSLSKPSSPNWILKSFKSKLNIKTKVKIYATCTFFSLLFLGKSLGPNWISKSKIKSVQPASFLLQLLGSNQTSKLKISKSKPKSIWPTYFSPHFLSLNQISKSESQSLQFIRFFFNLQVQIEYQNQSQNWCTLTFYTATCTFFSVTFKPRSNIKDL